MKSVNIYVPPQVLENTQVYALAFLEDPRVFDVQVCYVNRGRDGSMITVVVEDPSLLLDIISQNYSLRELHFYETFFAADLCYPVRVLDGGPGL